MISLVQKAAAGLLLESQELDKKEVSQVKYAKSDGWTRFGPSSKKQVAYLVQHCSGGTLLGCTLVPNTLLCITPDYASLENSFVLVVNKW